MQAPLTVRNGKLFRQEEGGCLKTGGDSHWTQDMHPTRTWGNAVGPIHGATHQNSGALVPHLNVFSHPFPSLRGACVLHAL